MERLRKDAMEMEDWKWIILGFSVGVLPDGSMDLNFD
jgi:hypothetical protein